MFRWASPSMLCSTVPTSPPRGELCPEFSSGTEGIFLQNGATTKTWSWLRGESKSKKTGQPQIDTQNESCKILRYFVVVFFYNSFNLPSPPWRVLSEKITSLLLLFDTWWGRRGGGWQVMNILVNVMHWRATCTTILTNIVVEANSVQYKHSGWCIRVHQEQPASILCGSGRLPPPPRPLYTYQRLDTAQALKNWETRKLIEMWLLQCFWLMFKRRWKICDLPPASCFS